MFKFFKRNIKFQIIYTIFFTTILYSILTPLVSYCQEETKTIVITKEDIQNTKPRPYPVYFDAKDLKAIEIMEKRHFSKTFNDEDDSRRLKNLEWELFGKIWQYSPTKSRIEKLKIASSNTMLIGTAMPAHLSSKRTIKRMRNNDIGLRDRDSVGLIDGFLRLMSPQAYEVFRKHSDHRFNDYEW